MNDDWRWTQAVRGPRFLWFPIPAYASLSVLIWIMHARIWTFCVAVIVIGVLSVLHMRRRPVPWVIRRFKCVLRGGVVAARPVWFRRRVQHLKSFDLIELD